MRSWAKRFGPSCRAHTASISLTASRITPVTLAALDEADLIVHVVTPEITSLRNAARFFQLAGQLGATGTPVFVVGDRVMNGAVGYAALKEAIEAARRKT